MSDKKPYHVDPHPDHPQSAIDLFNSGEQPSPPDIDALVRQSKKSSDTTESNGWPVKHHPELDRSNDTSDRLKMEVGGYRSTPKHATLEGVADLPIGKIKR